VDHYLWRQEPLSTRQTQLAVALELELLLAMELVLAMALVLELEGLERKAMCNQSLFLWDIP